MSVHPGLQIEMTCPTHTRKDGKEGTCHPSFVQLVPRRGGLHPRPEGTGGPIPEGGNLNGNLALCTANISFLLVSFLCLLTPKVSSHQP